MELGLIRRNICDIFTVGPFTLGVTLMLLGGESLFL
jgi:hypothetical protein